MATGRDSTHNGSLTNELPDSVNEVRGLQRGLLWLLALLVRVWGRTLRMTGDYQTALNLTRCDVPVTVVVWHNRLFVVAELAKRYRTERPIHALVSASRDGAWLAEFLRMIGVGPVRGSSSNFGREAASAMIARLREGDDVALTPDGPRGPMYNLEPGVLVITRRADAPMVLVGAEFGPALRLKSWDRFYIPLPFSRVKMRSVVLPVRRPDGEKTTTEDVRNAMLAINPDPRG